MAKVVIPGIYLGTIKGIESGDYPVDIAGNHLIGINNYPDWIILPGAAYASTSTITYTCLDSATSDTLAYKLIGGLFTCTTSNGATRKYGYIDNFSRTTTTMTLTLVTTADLAASDINFRFSILYKIGAFTNDLRVRIPGELVADANNYVGAYELDIKYDSILLPVDFSCLTAAAGTGAANVVNIYSGTSALYSSGQDLTTNTVYRKRRATTFEISAGSNVTLRQTSVGGATTKPQGLQARIFLPFKHIFLGAAA